MSNRLTVNEALRLMSKRAGKSLTQISREITEATPAAFLNMVSRGSMKMSVGASMAEACGYKLMLVPDDYEIEDAIEIKGEVDNE